MKEVILELFGELFKEFSFLEKNPKCFPYKETFLENHGLYTNVLCGKLSDGTVGSKTITVDEYKGSLKSCTIINDNNGNLLSIDSGFLTILRSGLVAAYVVWRAGKLHSKIGFIGGGKINLMTAQLLARLGSKDFTMVGGREKIGKNVNAFEQVTGCDFKIGYLDLQKCDVLISCTNSNNGDGLLEINDYPGVTLSISQDGGFTLGRSFRSQMRLFSDYPGQLEYYFKEEFPFDIKERTFYNLNTLDRFGRSGVYLFGTIVADLVVAKFQLNRKEDIEKIAKIYFDGLINLV